MSPSITPSSEGDPPDGGMRAPFRIDVFVFDGWGELDALGPYEVFSGVPTWDVALVALDGPRMVTAAHGLSVSAAAPRSDPQLVLIPGGGWHNHDGPGVQLEVRLGHLARAVAEHHRRGAIVASVCSGAHVLAAAGLLDGRRATTHHTSWDDLEAAGAVVARGERYVDLGDVATAGGIMERASSRVAHRREICRPRPACAQRR